MQIIMGFFKQNLTWNLLILILILDIKITQLTIKY